MEAHLPDDASRRRWYARAISKKKPRNVTLLERHTRRWRRHFSYPWSYSIPSEVLPLLLAASSRITKLIYARFSSFFSFFSGKQNPHEGPPRQFTAKQNRNTLSLVSVSGLHHCRLKGLWNSIGHWKCGIFMWELNVSSHCRYVKGGQKGACITRHTLLGLKWTAYTGGIKKMANLSAIRA